MKNIKFYGAAAALSAAVLWLVHTFSLLEVPVLFGLEVPETEGSVDFIQLVYWLWLLFPLWFAAGYMIDGKLKMRAVTVFRYGSGLRWWLSIVGNLLILSAAHSILMYAIAGAGVGSGRMTAVILVMAHGVMILFLFAALLLCTGRRIVSTAILIMAEAFGFIIPEIYGADAVCVPVMWGMYIRRSMGGAGFDPVWAIAAETAVTAVCILAMCSVGVPRDNTVKNG